MSNFRPLLAEKADMSKVEFPLLASPKYDGFRCLVVGGNPVSRNMKPIANHYVYGKLKEINLPKLDGELLTYTGNKVDEFNIVQSKLTTRSGLPEFKFMVFDHFGSPDEAFVNRDQKARDWIKANPSKHVEHVWQQVINNVEELDQYEAEQLADGWEGIMLRSFDGRYKYGRSTVNEGILLKVKRFQDDEAIVVSAHELMHNANEETVNELGYTERSSHKANMEGMDTLGKFTVRWGEVEFDIGTGFSASERQKYWGDKDKLVGQRLTFKFQGVGPNGKPRFPVFKGFRYD